MGSRFGFFYLFTFFMIPLSSTIKKLGLGLALGATVPLAAHAQTSDRKTNLSVYYNWLQYHGDLGTEWFKSDKVMYGGGLTLSQYIAPGLDIGLDLSYGRMTFAADPPKNMQFPYSGFKANVYNVGVPFKFKLNNGWALKEDAFIAPYLVIQPDLVFASHDFYSARGAKTGGDTQYALDLQGAAGIKFQFSDAVALFVQTGQHYLFTDKLDGIAGPGNLNDRYLQHKIGLSFNMGSAKDEDMDGVPDKKDKCPGTPQGVAVDATGCPLDGDGDGVPDYQDKCPTEKGLASLEGCPDRDGDGVRDSEDECPDTPGKAELQGCPDADGDGVRDSDDKCPDTPAGVAVDATGCPLDRDGDGVPDYQDRCPTSPGPASNKGCPEVKEETKKVLNEATKYIQFEFNKATLKASSDAKLEQLVSILNEYPDYNLSIAGHTDSKGSDAYNQQLSYDRAAAARTYMISKGIAESRIESRGYGETKPIATNATEAGRALNRRVDFDLYLPGDPNPAEVKYGPQPTLKELGETNPAPPTNKAKAPMRKKTPMRKAPMKK